MGRSQNSSEPGRALRSGNPGASFAAVGAKADWFTRDHPLDYGYGGGSPFAKLVEADGKVLLVGAPFDAMSLLHHAEHLARVPDKHVCRMEVPFLVDGGTEWRMIEEYDTADPVIEGLAPAYFGEIVHKFLVSGRGSTGKIGSAQSALVSAPEIVCFAIDWLEHNSGCEAG